MDSQGVNTRPGTAGPVTTGPAMPEPLAGLRAARRAECAAQAAVVEWVARLAQRCRTEVAERLAGLAADCDAGGHARSDQDAEEFAEKLAIDAVSCALGIGRAAAAELVDLSTRLTSVLPNVLAAWAAGTLDGERVRVLARATEVLDDATARRVAAELLPDAGSGPWQQLPPGKWRTQVERAVVRADRAAAERRRAAALAARRVQAWADGDGTGVLQLRGDAADIALADQVVTDLARAWPARDVDGSLLSMDQRRADALMGVFRAIRDGSLAAYPDPNQGTDLGSADSGALTTPAGSAFGPAVAVPRVPVRRVHDLGLVLHADALFGDGPAAEETAQLRGLGRPSVVDPASARALARKQLRHGAPVQVLVVDGSGALAHVVCLDRKAGQICRTRATLVGAVRQALSIRPDLVTDGHEPTEAIARHVRAEAPTCSFYNCPRRARSCDLDHDTPWPRGPTWVGNLDPKCRRHHNAKTVGAVRTTLTAGPGMGGRTVQWTLPAGIAVTTSPEPLPGVAPMPDPRPA